MPSKAVYIFLTILGLAHASVSAETKTLSRSPHGSVKNPQKLQTAVRLKIWEVRTAPVALLASWYTLDISYRLTNQIATGPAAISFGCNGSAGMLTPCWKGYALGWQGAYYLQGVQVNTPYLSVHAYYDSYNSFSHDVIKSHDEVKGFRAHAIFGYMFHAPVNFLWYLGAGWEVRSYTRTTVAEGVVDSASKPSTTQFLSNPMLEAKVGFQF